MPVLRKDELRRSIPAMRRASLLEQNRERFGDEDPGRAETLIDAFVQENLLVNAGIGLGNLFTPREPLQLGYNAFEDDPDIAFRHPEFMSDFVDSRGPEDTRRISGEIEAELARRSRLSKAGGFGVAASMTAGVLSPESLIPGAAVGRAYQVGKAIKGLSRARQVALLARSGLARGALNASLSGLIAESIAQTGLGIAQRTRTVEEATFNLIGASIFAGLLGGVAGAVGESRRGLRQIVIDEAREGLTGKRLDINADDYRGLPGEEQRRLLVQDIAAQGHGELAGLIAQPQSVLGGLFRKGLRAFPNTRLLTSRTNIGPKLIKRLTDTPLLRVRDLELGDDVGTSVEAAVQIRYARVADAILRIRDIYDDAVRAGMRGMRRSEFQEEVTRALRREDEAAENVIDARQRTAIADAAKVARKVFDELADESEAVGLLSSRELKGTAKSYVTRVWDRAKITTTEGRRELKKILVEHFSNNKNQRRDPEALANDVIDSLLRSRTGTSFIPDVVGEAGPFRERLILVRDADIEQFFVNDIIDVLQRFTNSVAPQVEMAKAMRTASGVLDTLPARLEAAALMAEKSGDPAPLLDILEDTASLRAGAAFASQLTEEGLSKQAQVERLVAALPELRREFRELDARHRNKRIRVDRYENALTTRRRIEGEIGGTGFDSLPKSVRDAFNSEMERFLTVSTTRKAAPGSPGAERLASLTERTLLDEAAERLRLAKVAEKELQGELAFTTRPRVRRARRPLREVSAIKADLRLARERRAGARRALQERQKVFRKRRRELLRQPATRRKFFHVWRRWIEDQGEDLFPATREALGRFAAAPKAARLRDAGREYVAATGRVEALRANIARTRREAASLARERAAADAALEEATSELTELRRDAQTIDPGVPLRTDPKTDDLRALGRMAANAIGDARHRQAIRAVRLDDQVELLKRQFNELMDEPGANVRRLEGEKESEIRDLEAVRDRVLNREGLLRQDPHHWAFSVGRGLRRINFMRFMGGVTLSSLPDLAMPLFVNGLRPTIRAYRAFLRTPLVELRQQLRLRPTEALRDLSLKEELVRLTVALELADNARVKSFGDIGDLVSSGNRLEEGVDRLANEFANLTLIGRWNAINKGIATLAIMNRALSDIDLLVTKETLSVSGRKNLAAAGINARMAERIHEQFVKHGQTVDGQRLARTQFWDDGEAKKIFQDAAMADVRRTIITPSAGDLPRWMSRPVGRLLGQFRSFAMSSTTKVLGSGLQRHDAAVVQGAIFSVILGGGAWALKELIRGRDPSEADLSAWVQNSIDRSGMLGIAMDVNGALERMTHGRIGMSALTGGGPSTRFQARNVVDAFLGPSVGTATDLAQVFGSPFGEGGMTQNDLRAARRLVPFNQLFYIRWLFDELEGTAAAGFGLPKDRREARRRLRKGF